VSREHCLLDANAPKSFDGVFVFEALHHAFDWRQAIQASFHCLKEGGWLVLANEPNLLHTYISYRVATGFPIRMKSV
jgi:SAM-dependent methyltransferase